ncbi:MAG: 50S ribosomal protein L30 [Candidatus Bathyarchaeia archaeon]|nr:50S ribosomal protein L30 [Candidatus Bathyarchaeota archaeon]
MSIEKGSKCLAVVRVRGTVNVRGDIEDTLRMLNLTRNCHATLIDDRPSYMGMLQKVQNQVTWGEVSKEVIAMLLRERGRLVGNRKLTEDYVKKIGFESIDDLAEAIYNLKVEFNKLPGIKPVFRLHPPSKGYGGSVKKTWKSGGVTGYRGESINDLLKRMI